MDRLTRFCDGDCYIKLLLVSGRQLTVAPVQVLYNWKSGVWYLVYRDKPPSGELQTIRLEKIYGAQATGRKHGIGKEEIVSERAEAQKKISGLFGTGMDKPTAVELIFEDCFNVMEKVWRRLGSQVQETVRLRNGDFYVRVNVTGANDFLNWVRGFGSSVMILSPEWLREKHISSARKTLAAYGEKYDY